MQPIQPAQRVERPPPPISPKIIIDSADDDDEESETSTESSYTMSQQFHSLPWPSPATPRSGRESPIPLARGMSPASSMPPTHTPESSLTVWSGAFVTHNLGHNAVRTSGGGAAVGASWTSASRDMATFDLLRATNGLGPSREGLTSGGSGRLRTGKGTPANTALTEANIDYLRRVPSATGGSGGRRSARAAQQNGGRPPKTQPTSTSPSPTAAGGSGGANRPVHQGSVSAAVAAFNKQWPKEATAAGSRDEPRVVSPVCFRDRGKGVIGATSAADDSITMLNAKHSTARPTEASASPSAGEWYVTTTHADEGIGRPVVSATSTSPKHSPPGTALNALSSAPPLTTVSDAAQTTAVTPVAEGVVGSASRPTSSTEGRPRRTSSRHQGQVLPADVSATVAPLPAAPVLPLVPSPTAAAPAVTRRRSATTGRRRAPTMTSPTPDVVEASNGVTAASASPTVAASPLGRVGTSSGTPVAARRAVTASVKAVPAAPSQYISGGRLVQAARRISVVSPVDAPLSKAPPGPRTRSSERKAPADRERTKPTEAVVTGSSTPSDAVNGNTTGPASAAEGIVSPVAAVSSSSNGVGDQPAESADMDSLVSCSVHTIPPNKARQLRQTQPPLPPAPSSTADGGANTPLDADAGPKSGEAALPCLTVQSPPATSADAKSDGRITPLLTVEVARLTTAPPRRVAKATAGASRATSAGVKVAPPAPPPQTAHNPAGPAVLSPNEAPAALSTGAAAGPSPLVSHQEAPKRPSAKALLPSSAPNSDDSQSEPETPTRSSRGESTSRRRAASSNSGTVLAATRRGVAVNRSSNNTSREWNITTSCECPTSVASTQLPLSVRMAVNMRSSSADTSDRGEREMSLGSTLSNSAGNSTTDNPTTSVPGTPAVRHRSRLPQPPFSLDGPANTPRRDAPAGTAGGGDPPATLRPQHPGILSPVAPPGVLQLTSPLVSPIPSAALRARRATHAVNTSAERMRLSDGRGCGPAQAERRHTVSGAASPAAVASAVRRGRPQVAAPTAATTAGGGTAVSRASRAVPGPSTMRVGGRQLPRMIPSPDDDAEERERRPVKAPTTGTSTSGGEGDDTTTASSEAFLAHRRRAHSSPACALAHGNGGEASDAARPSPAVGQGLNTHKSVEEARETRQEHPLRPESHLPASPKDKGPSRGSRIASNNPSTHSVDGAGALQLPPARAAAGEDTVFQTSPLRLPALTRFPRTPVVPATPETPPSVPTAPAHAAGDADEIRQESSGSGHAQVVAPGGRRRSSSRMADDGLNTVTDSNASSVNNRNDATHSDGSVNGEAAETTTGNKSFSRKTPQPRQRAPSVFFV